MASVIDRSLEDLIIDKMVAALVAFSAEQKAIQASVAFNTVRDQLRPPGLKQLPLVNIWLDTLTPEEGGTSTKTCEQETAEINIDCYTRGVEAEGAPSDQNAMLRLYYLKHQVKYGLYKLINADFGFSPGIIARKRWPRFQLFQTDTKMPEEQIVGGRWTMSIEYAWQPEDIATVSLEELRVDAGMFDAYYSYGGGT